MSELKNKKLYLLDMDGTIYLGNRLFDGTLDFLQYVRDIGGRYIFLTNNSSKGVESYIKKLASMGIESCADDFFTSANATIVYLKKKGYNKIYALGTESFKSQLKEAGLPVYDGLDSSDEDADIQSFDCLCMGFDTELTFKKLEDACKLLLLNKSIDYVATNPDWVCPTEYGSVPDCGSISAAIKNATGRLPYFIGKPQPDMAYLAMEKTGYAPDKTALIGDRLYTDIACGVNAGISTIFVLSGEGTMQDVEASDKKPEFIFKDIRELYDTLTK